MFYRHTHVCMYSQKLPICPFLKVKRIGKVEKKERKKVREKRKAGERKIDEDERKI